MQTTITHCFRSTSNKIGTSEKTAKSLPHTHTRLTLKKVGRSLDTYRCTKELARVVYHVLQCVSPNCLLLCLFGHPQKPAPARPPPSPLRLPQKNESRIDSSYKRLDKEIQDFRKKNYKNVLRPVIETGAYAILHKYGKHRCYLYTTTVLQYHSRFLY